jgi:hypothetical protein
VLLDQCDDCLATVRRRSREAGVAVNLVFLLGRIERVIERIRRLRDLAVAPDRARAVGFFVLLVRQENRRHSVRDLPSGTTELLARRVRRAVPRGGGRGTADRGDGAAQDPHCEARTAARSGCRSRATWWSRSSPLSPSRWSPTAFSAGSPWTPRRPRTCCTT